MCMLAISRFSVNTRTRQDTWCGETFRKYTNETRVKGLSNKFVTQLQKAQFKKRIALLKVPSSWEIVHTNDNIVFKYNDDIHSVPKYGIYTNDTLAFRIRYFLWMLPNNHELYTTSFHSFQNITVSNLINILTSYDVCNGISDVAAANFIEHSVPKYFSLSSPGAIISPLFQSKCYRHPSCSIYFFLAVGNTNCTHCNKAETKELKRLKQKESKLLVAAK